MKGALGCQECPGVVDGAFDSRSSTAPQPASPCTKSARAAAGNAAAGTLVAEVLVAHKDELGKQGEECAADFLVAAGYRVIARNWRCTQGEIDLVVERDGEVVFVEVKTRSGTGFGHPFEAITAVKLARLRRLAALWCDEAESRPRRIRIDAIAVIAERGRVPVIEHLAGVF